MKVLFSISDDYGYVSRLIAMKKNIFQSNPILANSYKCGRVRGFGNLREEKRSQVTPSASQTYELYDCGDFLL